MQYKWIQIPENETTDSQYQQKLEFTIKGPSHMYFYFHNTDENETAPSNELNENEYVIDYLSGDKRQVVLNVIPHVSNSPHLNIFLRQLLIMCLS